MTEAQKELHRQACRRYAAKNREVINERARARNWDYNPVKAKTKRETFYKKHPARAILSTVKTRATRKGLPYDLTEEWYNSEWEKGCAVTGVAFAAHRSGSPWVAHVDKKIPEEGYTMENCRLVCAMYNQAKGKWSDEDVEDMAFCIVKNSDV